MPNKFDPYRESLVVEADTLWPEEYGDLGVDRRIVLETKLHATPEAAAHLEYIRTHTGFRRQITVAPEDIARLGTQDSS